MARARRRFMVGAAEGWESGYQAVEKMKFSDFVDALEAVHAKENSQKASKRSAADIQHGQMKE